MKFKAAVLIEQNKPLETIEIEIPKLSFGQVLVKLHCSGVCGSQIGEIKGVKGPDKYLPHLLGHEGAATVLECGEGVKTLAPDNKVVLHWRPGEGLQGEPPLYFSPDLGKINAGWVTSFNEYAVISENRLTPIDSDIDNVSAAMLGCAALTGIGVVNNNAKVKIGESVLILGAGGIGLNMVQAAKMAGAYPIIAVDIFQNRIELAKELGATHAIMGNDLEHVKEEVKKICGEVDVAIDNTGCPKVIEAAYSISSKCGRIILVGVPAKNQNASIYTLPLHFGKILTGSHGGEANPAEDIPRYTKLLKAELLDFSKLIAQHYPLEDINSAINDMESGKVAGRCIIDM